MRICLFTATFLPRIGGHETVVNELAGHFLACGHEPVVLAQHMSVSGTKGLVDVPYQVVRFRKPFSQNWDLGALRRALASLYKKWPFDVLHSHSSYPTGYIAVKFGKEKNIPVVITPHGSDIAETSRFGDRPLIQKRIRYALGNADTVTILSDYMKERVALASDETAVKLARIPNGIHVDWFSKKAPVPDDISEKIRSRSEKYFLFLGRLHPRKGVDVLNEAFRLAAPEMAEVSLVIAGQGTQENSLRTQANESGLSSRIHFVGSVQGQKKLWLLQNCVALVVPTKSWEAFGVVVIEGMASSVPVIGSEIGGIVDLIDNGKDGFLVKPNDAQALASALVKLSQNSPMQKEMGQRGFEKAKRYDWPRVTQQYLALFEKLIAAKENIVTPNSVSP